MSQTVLLIHDDGAKAKVVKDRLLNPLDAFFVLEWVGRCSDGLHLLRTRGQKRIAAILVNLFLPDSEGLETFDRIFKVAPDIPILILSSQEHEATAKLAVQIGAQDYLLENDLDGYLLPKAFRNILERASNAEALFSEKERAQLTLNSIGDAVVCTNASGAVTFLNPAAEALTGWPAGEATGCAFAQIFRIIDVLDHRRPLDPMTLVIKADKTMHLPQGCILIRRDGIDRKSVV